MSWALVLLVLVSSLLVHQKSEVTKDSTNIEEYDDDDRGPVFEVVASFLRLSQPPPPVDEVGAGPAGGRRHVCCRLYALLHAMAPSGTDSAEITAICLKYRTGMGGGGCGGKSLASYF